MATIAGRRRDSSPLPCRPARPTTGRPTRVSRLRSWRCAERERQVRSGTGTSWGHGPETMNVLCQRLNSYRPNFSDTLVVVRG
jgi:hypothetical protein